jgi:chemotaxis protein histidine kinase CheA
MLEDQDSEFILGIFLMEAWDTVAAVEEGVRRLAAGEPVSSGVLDSLVIVAHRLKGAAALHGYPVVSAVALVLEEMIEKLPATPDGERSRRVEVLADVVATVKRMLELIGDDGREDVEAVVRLRARHPELFAPSAPPEPSREPVRLAEPGPAATLDTFPTSPPLLPPPSLPPSSIGDSVSADGHGPAGGGAASSDPAALSPSAAAPHPWASAAPVEEAVAEGLLRELAAGFNATEATS